MSDDVVRVLGTGASGDIDHPEARPVIAVDPVVPSAVEPAPAELPPAVDPAVPVVDPPVEVDPHE